MSTKTGIYHWKLGDVALARICKKVYAKVQVVKNEDGIFHDVKGIVIFDFVFLVPNLVFVQFTILDHGN